MKALLFYVVLIYLQTLSLNAQPPGMKDDRLGPSGNQPPGIHGKIVDAESGEALTGAHVILKSLETGREMTMLSDAEGEFRFMMIQEGVYNLRISYVGFEEYNNSIAILNPRKDLGEIRLKKKPEEIEEVTVTEQIPLAVVREDTVEYLADAYKTTPDASAEDLVAKMPGIEVSQGSVKAQGETVEKVQVDGKPFFNNDPTLALRNLPAEIIEKIQIYEEQSEQSQFTGFDDGNTIRTMNLVTRRNMRNGQFGTISAGYGPDNAYAVGGNLNMFNAGRRISILGQSNNLNQQGFSMQDILGVMGSAGGRGMRSGGMGRPGGMGGGTRMDMSNFMIGQQSGVSDIHTLGLNYNDNWGEKLRVSGNYFYNRVNNLTERNTNQLYLLSGFEGQEYLEESTSERFNSNHRMFLRLDYQFNEKNRIMFRPNLSLQDNHSESGILGETHLLTQILNRTVNDYNSDSEGLNLSNDLVLMHAFEKNGRTVSLNIRHSYNDRDGRNYLLAVNDYYEDNFLSSDSLDQLNNNISNGSSVSGRLMYTEPVRENSQLQINYNYSYNWNSADQTTYDHNLISDAYDRVDSLLSSVFENRYHRQELGAGYRYRKEGAMLSTSLNYQATHLLNDEEYPRPFSGDYRFYALLPMVMLNFELGDNSNIRLMLRTSSNVPSVSQLQTVVDNTNPLRLSTGNPELEPDVSQNYIIRFSTAGVKKASMFYAGVRVNSSWKHITNSTFIAGRDTIIDGIELQKGSQLIRPVNLDGYWRVNLFSTYGIPISKIHCNLNLTASLNLSRNPGLINGEQGHSLDRSAALGFALVSNISRDLDFTLSSNSTYSQPVSTFNENLSEEYFYQVSSLRFKWIIKSDWVLSTDVVHSMYKGLSQGFDQSFAQWNLSGGRKLFRNRRGEVSLKFFDLLNQNTSIQRTITESYIEDVKTNVLDRYFLVIFRYDLRNMGI